MRSITFVLAAILACASGAALAWQEYAYPEYGFALAFPGDPQVQNTVHQVAPGRTVPAQVYSLRQNKIDLTMTIANLEGTGLDEKTVIDHAIKTLSAGGKVSENVPQRIYRIYGRAFTVEGADGSHLAAMAFHHKGRLYQIAGKALAGAGADAEFESVRFQQSLTFTDGSSNRTEAQVRAIREGCRGLIGAVNAGGNPVNPAGLDDPRCETRAGQ